MSSSSWKYLYIVLVFLCASLYQVSYMPLGWNVCASVGVLVLFSIVILSMVQTLIDKFSTRNVSILFLSIVGGFGSAAILSLCMKEVFAISQPQGPWNSLLKFLLPLSCSIASFVILEASSLFRPTLTSVETRHSSPTVVPAKKFIPDVSALEDGRIVDLARLGLFDNQLLIPSFLAKELRMHFETGDEIARIRARRALEALRKLESVSRYEPAPTHCQIPEEGELPEKLMAYAKAEQACLISTEPSSKSDDQGTPQILTIDTISSALKPPIPKGENLAIKIQRLGKEPKQGIGYLDDGTMVVVNGGGDYLGRMVRTQVLSQKYSTSGKIVFCNVREDEDDRSLTVTNIEAGHYNAGLS